MSEQNCSRENDIQEDVRKKSSDQGGFVAVLHELEEKFYGPESPLDSKGRIFLYIRHRALRDWTEKKRIPKSEIIAATGVEKRSAERALQSLEREKHIYVTRTKNGKVWSENIYELHPFRYGTDYIYRPPKPSFKVHYGSKGHTSNPEKSIHADSGSYPQSESLPTQTPADLPTNESAGLPTQTPADRGVKISESFENSPPKNPIKEPIKKTLSEECDSHIETESGKKAREAAMASIRMLVGGGLRSMPR